MDTDGLGPTRHLLTYRFEVDGREIVAESGVSRERYGNLAPGDTVSVRYVPSDPSITEFSNGIYRGRVWQSFLFSCMMFAMVVPMVIGDRGRDTLRARRNG